MFIGRRPDGSIYGTWSSPQPKDEFHPGVEEVHDDHPDLVAFTTRDMPVVVDTATRIKALEDRLAAVEMSAVLEK